MIRGPGSLNILQSEWAPRWNPKERLIWGHNAAQAFLARWVTLDIHPNSVMLGTKEEESREGLSSKLLILFKYFR